MSATNTIQTHMLGDHRVGKIMNAKNLDADEEGRRTAGGVSLGQDSISPTVSNQSGDRRGFLLGRG